MATGDLMELKVYEDYKGPKLSPEFKSQIQKGDYSGVTKEFTKQLQELINSGLFAGIKASEEAGGESLEDMFAGVLKEIKKQGDIIGNDTEINKNEIDVLTLIVQAAKKEVVTGVFDKVLTDVYQDIVVPSEKFMDESAWGTFIEKQWWGVEGVEHSKPTGDIEGMVNGKMVAAELKLTAGAKNILAGQITFNGFEIETYRRNEKGVWKEKVSINKEQLNNPYFRMGLIIYKMIVKMYNFLYFYIDMVDENESGRSQNIVIRTMILYTTLWIEKVISFVMDSVNVTFERYGDAKPSEVKGDKTIGTQTFVIKITTKERDLLASIGKLGELYKRELFLIVNSKYAGSLKKIRTAYAIIRQAREFVSVDERLIGK